MTATSHESTTVQGAPRRVVENAWGALNRRYAIGAGVLAALLLLLWLAGMGPGAWRAQAPGPVGSGASDAAGAGARADASAAPGSAGGTAPAATGAAPAASTASGATPGASAAAAGGNGRPSPAAGRNGDAPANGAAAAGASGSAPANGTPPTGTAGSTGDGAPATPRSLPGAPVARLYFEPDQAWPSGEVGPRLAPVLARLKAEPGTKALVSGYHDLRGSPERNAALAQRRAQSVRRVLIREGVAADRIVLARPQQVQAGAGREARRVEVTVAR